MIIRLDYILIMEREKKFVKTGKIEFPTNNAYIAYAKCDMNDIKNLQNKISIFSKDEMKMYQCFKFEKRKRDYLLGRYAAKLAISKTIHTRKFEDISVLNGVFYQPILKITNTDASRIGISITHCDGKAIAIIYSPSLICGVDIEKVDNDKCVVMNSMLSKSETDMVTKYQNRIKMLTTLWTAKESLSKALCVGFMCKGEILEISDISFTDQYFIGDYGYFPQYRFISKIISDYSLTLAVPKSLDINPLLEAKNEIWA